MCVIGIELIKLTIFNLFFNLKNEYSEECKHHYKSIKILFINSVIWWENYPYGNQEILIFFNVIFIVADSVTFSTMPQCFKICKLLIIPLWEYNQYK